MISRAKLASELHRVRRAIAAAKPPRMLRVRFVEWLDHRDEATLYLTASGWCPQAGDVVEVKDAAGLDAVFRIVHTRGVLALGSPGRVLGRLVGPVPAKMVRLRKRERELVATLTTAVVKVGR